MAKGTILVTGGAGFVGSHLCDALIERGYRVVCVDNLATGSKENIAQLAENDDFVFEEADVNKLEEIAPVFERHNIDYIFHYACTVSVKLLEENPLVFLNDIEGTKNVVNLAKKHGIKKIAYSSTSEIYGDPVELPMREDSVHNMKPTDTYSIANLASENLVLRSGIAGVVYRFFNVYGPRQETSDYGFVVGRFMKKLVHDEAPIIYGDGSQTRSFIYVADNINICIDLFFNEKTAGEVINVGQPKETTVRELAELLIEISGKDAQPDYQPARGFDVKRRTPGTAKMESFTDVRPTHELREGLTNTYDWYRTHFSK